MPSVHHGAAARGVGAKPRSWRLASVTMRSRRDMFVFGIAALLLLAVSAFLEWGWVDIVLTGLAASFSVLFVVVLTRRQHDPNGPRGQH